MISSSSDVSPDFKWIPDYNIILDKIATTDNLQSIQWPKLRDIIKYKINQNVSLLLQETEETQSGPTITSSAILAGGGLRLPPFPPRRLDGLNASEAPKSYMTEQEAKELMGFIFTQLHEFEDNPPFTIQRVCELCLHPKQHYKTVGKYLRAVEKSLLVTSSWNAFPPEKNLGTSVPRATISMHPTASAPTTPLFSPIPFLHDDARRSKSRSPPPSPLILHGIDGSGPVFSTPLEQRAIGLVDELDDPSPGHMSEHPIALTSVTTPKSTATSRPLLGSLEDRFTKAKHAGEDVPLESDAMVVDDTEDKENKG